MITNITKLADYSQVRKGDIMSVISPITNRPCLTKIKSISIKENYFRYSGPPNLDFQGIVRGQGRLLETVLLRPTDKGIDILAGEEAYNHLISQIKYLTSPSSKPHKTGFRKSGDAQFPHYPGIDPNDSDGPYNRPDGH